MRHMISALLFILLTACQSAPAEPPQPAKPAISDQLDMSAVKVVANDTGLPANWHRHGVFMEIYVRGYADSDGDGIGDFNGVTEKLDYLADLGIRGIWLMPMMKSQDRDHGYAVTDYRSVEPDYGTMQDFQRLLDEAHKRGIGVIIDYLINHSAAQNPLFIDSNNNAGGKRNWYVWRDSYVRWTNWGGNDTWHQGKQGYYYGIFWDQMPDFNLRNGNVVDFHLNNLRYWLNMGVDGFRFDAVGTLFENGRNGMLNQRENHEFLRNVLQPLVAEYPNRYMVCENPDGSIQTASSCGSAFYFGLHGSMLASAKFGKLKSRLVKSLEQAPMQQMATLLSNHDSFAGGRLYQQFSGNEERYRMAAATLLTLPGIPFIYYGEEIGIGHSRNRSDPDPDHRLRTPMSWTSDERTAGFTTSVPFRETAANVKTHNVEEQLQRDDSLLSHYRYLIKLRNQYPALQTGELEILESDNAHVFSFIRRSKEKDSEQATWIMLNYDDTAQAASFDTSECWQLQQQWPDNQQRTKSQAKVSLPAYSLSLWSHCD